MFGFAAERVDASAARSAANGGSSNAARSVMVFLMG
jgi:hypothetical protein